MLCPLNRHLVVKPVEEKQEEKKSTILLPSDVKTQDDPYKAVELIKAHCDSNLKLGSILVVPAHVIEKIEFCGTAYHVILENHVIGYFQN